MGMRKLDQRLSVIWKFGKLLGAGTKVIEHQRHSGLEDVGIGDEAVLACVRRPEGHVRPHCTSVP